jgi:hypothetical protein
LVLQNFFNPFANPDLMESNGWSHSDMNVFWGEIAPCDHVVQIYENDEVFMNLLEGFVAGGIKAGDCVIVIGTRAHLAALDARLRADGFNVFDLTLREQFIALDAGETLAQFMVDGWPDENLFRHVVSGLFHRARKNKRPVRAFGEMVAVLWSQGNHGATVQLEHLWCKFSETEPFTLFCAYPRSGFTENMTESLARICRSHSKMIDARSDNDSQIAYQVAKVG